MKRKPRWTLEILTGALAVLCGLLFLVLLVQRPAGWPVLAVLVVKLATLSLSLKQDLNVLAETKDAWKL